MSKREIVYGTIRKSDGTIITGRQDDPLIDRARYFALLRHHGQTRHYTYEPHFIHCRAVAEATAERTDDAEVIAAAYLHDVLEDTNTTYDELAARFGERVAKLVLELTDVYTPEKYPDKNRAERKRLEAARLATISPEAKLIKLADITDNTSSGIVWHDPKYAIRFLREKADQLETLTKNRQ